MDQTCRIIENIDILNSFENDKKFLITMQSANFNYNHKNSSLQYDILIVDDLPYNIVVLEELLSDFKTIGKVVTAMNGQ